ncbi:MAG: DNA repair protein RadC [Bacilli bacterium]|nr:DNA repair protein RadC [Bacilli bacterium]
MDNKIKNIPLDDRPRERLINKGANSLSNEELLAILLGSGTKNLSVKSLSSLILSKSGSISDLSKLTYHDLIKIKGVGKAKACTVLSLIELSKRINRKTESVDRLKFNSPDKIFNFYKTVIDDNQEEFYVIYLDAKKRVIKDKLLFIGTVNHSLVHPRDIFKNAYNLNSTFIICMHTHPSLDSTPSENDLLVTKRIKKIGDIMGIKLIDHIIITKNNYYSFLENGQI